MKWKLRIVGYVLCILLAACAPISAQQTPPPQTPPPPPAQEATQPPSATPAAEDVRAVRWLIPYSLNAMPAHVTTESARSAARAIQEALNERSLLAGLQIEIDLFVPEEFDMYSENYRQELYQRIKDGGPYDLVSFARYESWVEDWIDEMLFRDIAPVLEQYIFLNNAITSWQLDQMRRDDRIYFISAVASSDLHEQSYLFINKATLHALNLEAPTTIDEYLAAAKAAQANGLFYATGYRTLDAFRRDYDGFPFMVLNDLVVFYEDGSIEPYISSQVLIDDHNLVASLAAIGNNAVYEGFILSGFGEQWPFFGTAPYFISARSIEAYITAYPDALEMIKLNPAAPELLNLNLFRQGITAIPSASVDDRGLQFLDWIYADKENYDLLVYGVPGMHYEMNAYGFPDNAKYPNAYNFRNEIQQTSFSNAAPGQSELLDELFSVHSYALMPWYGFVFDKRPVQESYDAVMSITTGESGVTAIARGELALSYQKQLYDDLKAAGLDEVLTECQRQYATFLEKKNLKP